MATLKNLVDETTTIKDELVTCHSNLKNNLTEKGIECSDADKMSSLIDRVRNIATAHFTVGDDVTVHTDNSENFYSKVTEYTYYPFEYVFICDGGYRVSIDYKSTQASYNSYNKFVIIDMNDIVVFEKEFFGNHTSYINVVADIVDVKKGYKLKVMGKTGYSSAVYAKNLKVLCNLELR